jgi:integrase/recombinase XerC
VNQLVPITSAALPTLAATTGEQASIRFLEFFAVNIRNPHKRQAYARSADEFLTWCASAALPSIGAVQAVHVATWIEAGTCELATPSVVSPQSVICSTGSSPARSCRSIRRARCAGRGTS